MHRSLPAVAVVLVMACNESSSGTSPIQAGVIDSAAVTPAVIVLGDSLTAGPGLNSAEAYPALLQQRARAAGYPHRIVNAGVSGDTTTDAVNRFERALVPETRVLVVALGANDGLRGHPVDTVKGNLRRIIDRAKSRDIRVLLCGMDTPPSHGWDYSIAFHNIFPDLARELDVPLMPFLLTGVIGDDRLNLPDRFHPNAAGMQAIASGMWPYLAPLLKAPSSVAR
jgi:acyl-CoA thioesterase I